MSETLNSAINADVFTAPAALAGLKPGDVLRLAPGVYSGFTLKYVKAWDRARPIVITSADPANRAIITDFVVKGAQGLVFRDVCLNATNPNTRGYGFQFIACQGVALGRVKVHGSLDGYAGNDPFGVQFRDCADVRVEGCEFTELNRGLLVGTTAGVRVKGNRFHLLRSDGMDFAQVRDVEITDNEISDIHREGTDHPDAIQFWTSGTSEASTDILVARNRIDRGDGQAMQGIFIRDEKGLPYERVTIEDNLILGTGWNALRVVGNMNAPSRDFTLRRNELVTFDAVDGVPTRELTTYILLQNVAGAVVEDNRAMQISFDRVAALTEARNEITKPASDRGAAALDAWVARLNPPQTIEDRVSALEARMSALEAR